MTEGSDGKSEPSEPYDSGYQSDVIHEEDEDVDDDDSTISPRAPSPAKKWKDVPRQVGSSRRQSKSSWRPHLKRDMSAERTFYRPESIDSTISRTDEDSGRISGSSWSSEEMALLQRSAVPTLQRPTPKRKGSTLLHPSPPPDVNADHQNMCSVRLVELTPPTTPRQSLEPPQRQGSTLLHPSSPELEPNTIAPNSKPLDLAFTLPPAAVRSQHSTSANLLPLPSPRFRNNSTLLHPSPPVDEPSSSVGGLPMVILTKTPMSPALTPDPTPTKSIFQRPASVLHSALSDDEWEEPLHSCQSDVEYESDDHSAEADTESFQDNAEQEIVVARTGRMARASRISFHGNQLRILQD